MPDYVVRQGDSIVSIAYINGLSVDKIWDHPNNARLRETRDNPNILYAGDVLYIPDKEQKEEPLATEQRYRFRKRSNSAMLRFRVLMDEINKESQDREGASSNSRDSESATTEDAQGNEPRADIPYVLEVEGNLISGTIGDDGLIECAIPSDAKKGQVILFPGSQRELVYPLEIGHLNPPAELSGIKQRLRNLGFYSGDCSDEPDDELKSALRQFQEKHDLPVTGEADDQTLNTLSDEHGG
ncbi:MAG: peptidoglycan-binding protein [Proteobacteria bacterium]|nr:peptidoglycan-binding protein [Pseudomonadota bacterium]